MFIFIKIRIYLTQEWKPQKTIQSKPQVVQVLNEISISTSHKVRPGAFTLTSYFLSFSFIKFCVF